MTGPLKRQQLFKKNQERKREGSRRKTELMPKELELKQDIEDNFFFKVLLLFSGKFRRILYP